VASGHTLPPHPTRSAHYRAHIPRTHTHPTPPILPPIAPHPTLTPPHPIPTSPFLQVKFKKLESPGEEGFTLELLRGHDYDAVTAALAAHLGLDNPDLLRLTCQNGFSQQPQRAAIRYRAPGDLARMLCHSNHATDTLYYETLDLPLPELEQLKTLKVGERGRGGGLGLGRC
jgi:hypothetical protein